MKTEDTPQIDKGSIEQGYIFVPYSIVNVSTSINGEVVWYKNKWKNFLLKIKHLFVKPKYLKNQHYYNKPINKEYYKEIIIENKDGDN